MPESIQLIAKPGSHPHMPAPWSPAHLTTQSLASAEGVTATQGAIRATGLSSRLTGSDLYFHVFP